MSILKSKILSILFLIVIIICSSLPAWAQIKQESGETLTIGYVVVIMTAISSVVTIAFTYLLNIIFLRFFAQAPMKNKTVIFNFIVLSIVVNVIVVCVLTLGLDITTPWLILINPFYFICQYFFYSYLTKVEQFNNRRVLYYLVTCFAFTIIGQFITT
jgi:hypothetical protein